MRTILCVLFSLATAALPAQDTARPSKPTTPQGAAPQVVATPQDPQLAATARLYAAAKWPQGDLRPGFALGALELAGLRGDEPDLAPPAPWSRRYADTAGTPRVLIEAFVGDDVAFAHERLIGWLATRNDPALAPTARSEGVDVGDVGFVGRSTAPRLAWIAFVRGNVAVRVVCLDPRADPHPDMPAIAKAVDLALLAVPALPKGAAVPKPAIARFAAERAACTVGDAIVLDLDARDPAGGAPLYEFVLTGPGQGYVEVDRSGRQVLHTTGAGAMTITVQARGAIGTFAEATTHVDVAAR